jgi:putative endonuclease
MSGNFCVYLLQHQTGRTYVGISTDVERRVKQHNGILKGGARCTRMLGNGWELVKHSGYDFDRSEAQSLEKKVKRHRGVTSRLSMLKSLCITQVQK